jgi:ribonuclease P protein component
MLAARLRFPKSARLSRASEFARLKREGTSFHGRLMVLSVLKTEPESETRIGFVTSRRVGCAVMRNRVRRRLREAVRAVRPRIERGYWLVLIARQPASVASFEAIRIEWLQLAQRSAILTCS